MRKIIAWNVMTLDGFFEGDQPWKLDFHSTVWGEELEQLSKEQLADAGCILFGRKTYEGMAAHWTSAATEPGEIADAMNSTQKAVASRTLDAADWNNTRLLKGEAAEAIAALKQEPGKTIYIFGSADLIDTLMRADLIDEHRICIAPVILGSGTPLFKSADAMRNFTLIDARPLTNGGVILRYEPAR